MKSLILIGSLLFTPIVSANPLDTIQSVICNGFDNHFLSFTISVSRNLNCQDCSQNMEVVIVFPWEKGKLVYSKAVLVKGETVTFSEDDDHVNAEILGRVKGEDKYTYELRLQFPQATLDLDKKENKGVLYFKRIEDPDGKVDSSEMTCALSTLS